MKCFAPMRARTTLGTGDAYRLMLYGLVGEGIQITRNVPPLIEGELVRTRRGVIRIQRLQVTVESDGDGTLITVNGQPDAYALARRVARTLPQK